MSADQERLDAIRHRARELWEQDGRPEGRDLDYWLRAEREYEGRNKERKARRPPAKTLK